MYNTVIGRLLVEVIEVSLFRLVPIYIRTVTGKKNSLIYEEIILLFEKYKSNNR